MLTFAGYNCLLPDADGRLARDLRDFLPLDEASIFAPDPVGLHSERTSTRGDNKNGVGLPLPNWPKAPALQINQLYWPVTGATRFARMVVLMKQSDAGQVGPGGPHNLVIGDEDDPLTISMYALNPRPLFCPTTGKVTPISKGVSDLYLVPLVDRRYFYQWKNDGLTVEMGDTWDDVLTSLYGTLGIAGLPPVIHADYLKPDWTELNRITHNAAVLLDAAAASVMRRCVFKPDGTFTLDDGPEGRGVAPNQGVLGNTWQATAGGYFASDFIPAHVRVAFPKYEYGVGVTDGPEFGVYTKDVAPSVPGLMNTGLATRKLIVSSAFADYSTRSATPDNQADLDALATKIADDFYQWYGPTPLKGYDLTAPGIATGLSLAGRDDSVIFTYGEDREGDPIPQTTRIQSLPNDFGWEQQLSQDGDLWVLNEMEFGELFEDIVDSTGGAVDILRGDPGAQAPLVPNMRVLAYPWPWTSDDGQFEPTILGSDPRSDHLTDGTRVWLFWNRYESRWFVVPSGWHLAVVSDATIAAGTVSAGVYTPGTGAVLIQYLGDDGKIRATANSVTIQNWGPNILRQGQAGMVFQHPQSQAWFFIATSNTFGYGHIHQDAGSDGVDAKGGNVTQNAASHTANNAGGLTSYSLNILAAGDYRITLDMMVEWAAPQIVTGDSIFPPGGRVSFFIYKQATGGGAIAAIFNKTNLYVPTVLGSSGAIFALPFAIPWHRIVALAAGDTVWAEWKLVDAASHGLTVDWLNLSAQECSE